MKLVHVRFRRLAKFLGISGILVQALIIKPVQARSVNTENSNYAQPLPEIFLPVASLPNPIPSRESSEWDYIFTTLRNYYQRNSNNSASVAFARQMLTLTEGSYRNRQETGGWAGNFTRNALLVAARDIEQNPDFWNSPPPIRVSGASGWLLTRVCNNVTDSRIIDGLIDPKNNSPAAYDCGFARAGEYHVSRHLIPAFREAIKSEMESCCSGANQNPKARRRQLEELQSRIQNEHERLLNEVLIPGFNTVPGISQYTRRVGGDIVADRARELRNSTFEGLISELFGNSSQAETQANINGQWIGQYICSQGTTGVTLTINQSSTNISAEFGLYPLPQNPNVPKGTALYRGTFNPNTLEMSLQGVRWLQSPGANWQIVDFSGRFDSNLHRFDGRKHNPNCGAINLVRADWEGEWTGILTQPDNQFNYRINLRRSGGSKFTGTSRIEARGNSSIFGVMELRGEITGGGLLIQETGITSQNPPPGSRWCLKRGALQMSTSGSTPTLTGSWADPGCNAGQVQLQRQ